MVMLPLLLALLSDPAEARPAADHGTNVAVAAAPEPQRYWVNDTSYPGWQGFGWIENGRLVGVTVYRRAADPLWGNTTTAVAAPTYGEQFVRRYGPAYTLPTPATYPALFLPYYPALSPCASGSCPR